MIENKTVFVLGAGASVHLGFPLGVGLLQNVRNKLEHSQNTIHLNLREAYREDGKGISNKDWDYICKQTKKSMIYSPSVDHFLAQQKQHQLQNTVLKTMIAWDILEKEKNLSINAENNGINNELNWYIQLWHHMNYGLNNPTPQDFWNNNNINFITFNYDRSLEWFLSEAYRKTYNPEPDLMKQFLKHLETRIWHVYGSVEAGEHFDGAPPKIWLGAPLANDDPNHANYIIKAAKNIRTFNESAANSQQEKIWLQKMRECLRDASVFILGSSLNYINMNVLFNAENYYNNKMNIKNIGGIAYKISETSLDIVKKQIIDWISFGGKNTLEDQTMRLENMDCFNFMNTYQYVLSYS